MFSKVKIIFFMMKSSNFSDSHHRLIYVRVTGIYEEDHSHLDDIKLHFKSLQQIKLHFIQSSRTKVFVGNHYLKCCIRLASYNLKRKPNSTSSNSTEIKKGRPTRKGGKVYSKELDSKAQKLTFKTQSSRPGSIMSAMFTIQTITHPTADTTHPLIQIQSLHAQKQLIGKIGEGSQRVLSERKIKLSKLSNIFVSGTIDWSTIGGLPGLLLTVADQGKSKINISYGSDILNYFISMWRFFVFRKAIELNIVNGTEEVYHDDELSVRTVNIEPQVTEVSAQSISHSLMRKLRTIVKNMFPVDIPANNPNITEMSDPNLEIPINNVRLPKLQQSRVSTSYLIQFNSIRGKFMIEKAKALNIPPGQLYSKLSHGETITLEDGRKISPHEVLGDERTFSKVVVLDIPTNDYIPQMLSTKWTLNGGSENTPEKDNGREICAVYYFLGEYVDVEGESFQKLVKLFPEAHHFISHPKYSPNDITFRGSLRNVLKLKTIHGDLLALPHYNEVSERSLSNGMEPMISGQRLNVYPDKVVYDENEINRPIGEFVEEVKQEIKILDLDLDIEKPKIQLVREDQSDDAKRVSNLKDKIEAITLGTGSAIPSKYRNVISTLIRFPTCQNGDSLNYKSVLLDCGENTMGTLKRMYGPELPKYLREIKLVFISHLHADHHLGTIPVIKSILAMKQELFVVCPWQFRRFLREQLSVEEGVDLSLMKYINCEDFIMGKPIEEYSATDLELFKDIKMEERCTGNKQKSRSRSSSPAKVPYTRDLDTMQKLSDMGFDLQTCRAIHCHWAYSVTIHNTELDFKLSYSGDTRPNMKFVSMGKGSDLLIHEATLDDLLIEDALMKKHTTMTEAVTIAKLMKAKKLILTHFSQRYFNVPLFKKNKDFKENLKYINEKLAERKIKTYNDVDDWELEIVLAFDNMRVRYSDIGLQYDFIDLVNQLFAKDVENEEELVPEPLAGNKLKKRKCT